jgi:deoxyribodipyrimidine photo-lyase
VTVSVVWFRRDLRIHDHSALSAAVQAGDRVAPLFVVDDRLLAGRWRSPNRLWFMRASIEALAADLAELGAPLTVVRGDPRVEVAAFAASVGATRVLVSRDYAPYGRVRDRVVSEQLDVLGIECHVAPGGLIVEPEDVTTAAGTPYRVYGPFRTSWLLVPRRAVLPAPQAIRAATMPRRGADRTPGHTLLDDVLAPVTPTADPASLPVPGEPAARQRLDRWATGPALERYAIDRDRLDLDGTSHLGADLRWGLLSPTEVAERCAGEDDGRRRFLDELAWRDFYAHLLWHEPRVARQAFHGAFEDVARSSDPTLLAAWTAGRTGYPVIDAAMRQLRATGWMPNRARMIVAAFLTKDLGIDWRTGEAYFMTHLVDGDPASNNGGWQWSASTGTDAQPWFRVFDPTLQGRRHDPDGDYVRRWVDELRGIEGAAVHTPPAGAYLAPIVDHADARAAALAAYRGARDRAVEGSGRN